MSSAPNGDLTSEPAGTAGPNPGTPVVDFVARRRPQLAGVVVALAALALAAAIYYGWRAYERSPEPPPPTVATIDPATGELRLPEPVKPPAEAKPKGPLPPNAASYPECVLLALGSAMFACVFGGVGLSALVGIPRATTQERRREARTGILALGGLTGFVLMVLGFGAFLTGSYAGLLNTWVDTRVAPPGTYKVIVALMLFLGGAGLAFLAMQPARAEERDNAPLRRLIYGTNLALSVVLLLTLLVMANVIVSVRVPNRIDTTQSGLYSYALADASRDYLANLTAPVKFYSTIPENNPSAVVADARRLLALLRDANPRQVTVETLDPALNEAAIAKLRQAHPQAAQMADYGLLITVGEDEKLSAFLTINDLIEQKPGAQGVASQQFVGEAKVMRELMFLAEGQVRPLALFTTGHGELEVVADPARPASGGAAARKAAGLVQALEKIYVDAKALPFNGPDAAVPPGTAVLVVADAQAPFDPAQVAAIRKYVTEKQPGSGKFGKLIVLAGPTPRLDGTGVVSTGLENLLAEFGLVLGNDYLYTAVPLQQRMIYQDIVVQAGRGNPVVKDAAFQAILPNCRQVLAESRPGGQSRAERVLESVPNFPTWLEADRLDNPDRVFRALRTSREAQARKQVSQEPRAVAAAALDDAGGRVVAFGTADAFLDDPRRSGDAAGHGELFAQSVNYLRDRPEVAGIAAKTYGVYSFSPTADAVRILFLPALVALAGVTALGVGVWMLRRNK